MYLLYLDDSGATKNPTDVHVVLAGLAVFERQSHWLSTRLQELAVKLWPDSPDTLEFRGNAMFSGRSQWRGLPRDVRRNALVTALGILKRSKSVRLFGAAVHKQARSPHDPVEYAFEQIANRFDRFLGRLHHGGNTQRGLIVLDKSSYETSLQTLAREFRTVGHRWGQLHNLAEVPLFVDSTATRMIQYADLVAYAVGRYYRGDARYFDVVSSKFDNEGGVLHGLIHYKPFDDTCNCFACARR